jgi:hypothetical protein
MKKSNLLLLSALAVLLLSMGMYNVALKGEYRKQTYKDPYRDYEKLKFRDFQGIDIKANSRLKIRISQGPFGVWVLNRKKEKILLKKVGDRLQIGTTGDQNWVYQEGLMISCPQLSDIKVDAFFTETHSNGNTTETTTVMHDVAEVSVTGFTLDSLLLQPDRGSVIWLDKNNIGNLRAIAGKTHGSMTKLVITPQNTFRDADLTVQNKSQLTLNTSKITRLRYDFSDSTKINLNGAAMSLLKK